MRRNPDSSLVEQGVRRSLLGALNVMLSCGRISSRARRLFPAEMIENRRLALAVAATEQLREDIAARMALRAANHEDVALDLYATRQFGSVTQLYRAWAPKETRIAFRLLGILRSWLNNAYIAYDPDSFLDDSTVRVVLGEERPMKTAC